MLLYNISWCYNVGSSKYLYSKTLGSLSATQQLGSVVLQFLHHNYVAALLDDVFGIQSRGGCACAGPYAEELLGIDEPLATRFESTLMEDNRLDRTHLRRVREHSDKEIIR